ncbi:MAG: type VI secretion system Vgr family protein [Polyangiaceae bacterium]
MRDYILALDGCEPVTVTVHFKEHLHEPWQATLTLTPAESAEASGLSAEAVPLHWLGKSGVLELRDAHAMEGSHSGSRRHQGVVLAARSDSRLLEIEFGSRLHVLDLGEDHRVFVDKTEVEIADLLLQEAGFEVDNRTTRTLPKRRQCVQTGESTLRFIARILAESGVVYHCDPIGQETVVLIDSPEGFAEDPEPLLLARESGMRTEDRVLSDARLRLRRRTESVLLNDWNYEAPSADLSAPAGAEGALLEHYAFHDDYRTVDEGKALATLRLEALRQDARVLEGKTHCRDLAIGASVEVEADERAFSGRWLVVGMQFSSAVGEPDTTDFTPHRCTFQAVRAVDGFRPKVAVVPSNGFTRSLVTGAQGAEIHPDDQLRVKLRHHLDRRGAEGDVASPAPPTDKDSTWVRALQLPMSGSMLIPRVNWEVLCTHWGRSADEPLVLGRMVNAEFPPPSKLPEERLTTAFGTRSTPAGGGKGNRLAFDDTPGKEGMYLQAGKGLDDKTGNDKTTSIAGPDTLTVGGNRKLGTGQVYTNTVTGGQDYTVGSRKVAVSANKTINAGSETVMIGGARVFTVGGKQSVKASNVARCVGGAKAEAAIGGESRKVKGGNLTMIGGALAQACASAGVTVAGANAEAVAGVKSINAGTYGLAISGPLTETYGARTIKGAGVDLTGGTLSIKAGATTLKGSNVVFKAKAITISAGGATILISPGSVMIDATFKVDGGAKNKNDEDYG